MVRRANQRRLGKEELAHNKSDRCTTQQSRDNHDPGHPRGGTVPTPGDRDVCVLRGLSLLTGICVCCVIVHVDVCVGCGCVMMCAVTCGCVILCAARCVCIENVHVCTFKTPRVYLQNVRMFETGRRSNVHTVTRTNTTRHTTTPHHKAPRPQLHPPNHHEEDRRQGETTREHPKHKHRQPTQPNTPRSHKGRERADNARTRGWRVGKEERGERGQQRKNRKEVKRGQRC